MDPLTLLGAGYTLVTAASLIALHAGRPVCPRVGDWRIPPPVFLYTRAPFTLAEVREGFGHLEELGYQFGAFSVVRSAAPVPGAIVIGPPSVEVARSNAIAAASWAVAFEFEDDPMDLDGRFHGEDLELKTDAWHVLGPLSDGWIDLAYIGASKATIGDRDPVRIIAHEGAHSCAILHTETALFGRKREKPSDEEIETARAAGEKKPRGKKGAPRLGAVGRKSGHLMHPIYEKGGWNTAGMAAADLDTERMTLKRARRSR